MSVRLLIAVVVAGTLVVPAAIVARPDPPVDRPAPRAERAGATAYRYRHVSEWAYVERRTDVLARPGGRRVGRVGLETQDGTDELLLVIGERVVDGRQWYRVRLTSQRRAVGWVPAAKLGPLQRERTWLVLDRSRQRLSILRDGTVIARFSVGVGRAATPTPLGEFYLRSRLSDYDAPAYGVLAFGTSATSSLTDWPNGGIVGLHGTNRPDLLPGRVSHGCIRLRNRDILLLDRLVDVGTPLSVVR